MNKAKGSRGELRCIRMLEALGYACTKAGGSLGAFDVVALGPHDTRAIQVKCGKHPYLSPLEREAIELVRVGPGVRKELWLFKDYARVPVIEVLK